MSDPVELYVTETQTVEVSVSQSQSDLLASYDPAPTELTVLDAPGAQIVIQGDGGGDDLPEQQTLAINMPSLAAGATEDFSITAGSLLNLLSVTASTPSWVRFYGTAAARSADLRTSPGGVPPLAGEEFYAEVATTASPQTIRFSPVPLVQGTAGEVFVRLVNTDTVARAIVLSFSVLTLQV